MKLIFRILCAFGLVLCAAPVRASAMQPALADLAARVLPSVVSIASTDPVSSDSGNDDNNNGGDNNNSGNANPDNPNDDGSAYRPLKTADTSDAAGTVLPPPKAEEALGSGFVFDPAGFILTNAHVISGATSITVTFQDGTILPATVVGRDKDGDLAVLKVDAGRKLAAVSFGDSGKLRVGDYVLAVGNPFGLPGSTSAGIVSALDRNINENAYDDFIQTDATINRGNSGGPLFNMQGEVIGVNSAIYSPSGGSVGIGFAIPSAMAAPVAASLIQNGSMLRGWLGVSTQEVTPDIAKILDLNGTSGALVGGISPHSPADGKLQPGDNLISLAGVPINNPRALMIRTAEIAAGQSVKVKFYRDGSLKRATITLMTPPAALDDTEAAAPEAAPSNVIIAGIGMAVAAKSNAAGLQVMSVVPKGPAAKAGIVADDVVEQLAGAAIGSAADFQNQVEILAKIHQPAVLLISGDNADGSDPGPRWLALPVK